MKTDNLTIGKCRNCKSYWRVSQLKELTFKIPVGDGFINKKDFLCKICLNQLETGLNYQKKMEMKDL